MFRIKGAHMKKNGIVFDTTHATDNLRSRSCDFTYGNCKGFVETAQLEVAQPI